MRQTVQATTTQTTVVQIAPKVRKKLLTELRAYAGLKAQRDAIDAAMNAHKAAIGTLRESTGEESLAIDGFKVVRVAAVRKVLNHKKLVELGCAMAWIEEATENKLNKPYEKVTCPGEKEREYD